MRKLFAILIFIFLSLAIFADKKIVGARVNNQLMLLRIDMANYDMDCSVDGTNWNAVKIDWTNVLNAPSLATVATSGLYGDLSGTPSLATVATSGLYSDLSGTPSLATVATSGLYSDLSGTPSLTTVATSGSYSDLSGTPSEATISTAGLMSARDKTKLDALYTSVSINAQTASYTLVLDDKSKLVTMSNASANTITIPLASSVAFAVGSWIDIVNIGAGTCTVTATSGVTLNGTDGGTKELAQWSGTRLYKIATDTWVTR